MLTDYPDYVWPVQVLGGNVSITGGNIDAYITNTSLDVNVTNSSLDVNVVAGSLDVNVTNSVLTVSVDSGTVNIAKGLLIELPSAPTGTFSFTRYLWRNFLCKDQGIDELVYTGSVSSSYTSWTLLKSFTYRELVDRDTYIAGVHRISAKLGSRTPYSGVACEVYAEFVVEEYDPDTGTVTRTIGSGSTDVLSNDTTDWVDEVLPGVFEISKDLTNHVVEAGKYLQVKVNVYGRMESDVATGQWRYYDGVDTWITLSILTTPYE